MRYHTKNSSRSWAGALADSRRACLPPAPWRRGCGAGRPGLGGSALGGGGVRAAGVAAEQVVHDLARALLGLLDGLALAQVGQGALRLLAGVAGPQVVQGRLGLLGRVAGAQVAQLARGALAALALAEVLHPARRPVHVLRRVAAPARGAIGAPPPGGLGARVPPLVQPCGELPEPAVDVAHVYLLVPGFPKAGRPGGAVPHVQQDMSRFSPRPLEAAAPGASVTSGTLREAMPSLIVRVGSN